MNATIDARELAREPFVLRAVEIGDVDEAVLSAPENHRADRLDGLPRRQFVAGRSLVRTELGALLGLEPVDVPLAVTRYGRPFVHRCAIDFNLSHSDSYLLLGVTTRARIGVDIETAPPRAGTEKRFHPEEQVMLSGLRPCGRPDGFLRLWTAKEACVKSIGRIPAGSISGVRVTLEPTGRWNHVEWTTIRPFPGAIGAIALGPRS